MLEKMVTKQQKASLTIVNWLKWENILFALIGYILSQSVILGEIRPFAPALVGAISVWDKQRRWWALAGDRKSVV